MVPFAGIRAAYDLTQPSLYINIPAGQSVEVNHTVASTYDFSSFAAGTTFTFIPISEIYQTAPNDTPITVETNSVKVQVTDDFAGRAFNSLNTAQFTVQSDPCSDPIQSTATCSVPEKNQTLRNSLITAKALAAMAAFDIAANSSTKRYTHFFGTNHPQDIGNIYSEVALDIHNHKIVCEPDIPVNHCEGLTRLYTDVVTSEIVICDLFYDLPKLSSFCITDAMEDGSTVTHLLRELIGGVEGMVGGTLGCFPSTQIPTDEGKKTNPNNYACNVLEFLFSGNCKNVVLIE